MDGTSMDRRRTFAFGCGVYDGALFGCQCVNASGARAQCLTRALKWLIDHPHPRDAAASFAHELADQLGTSPVLVT